MKFNKKFIAVSAALVVLGIAGTVIATTYYVHTAISSVSITSHSTGDIVFAGHQYELTCTPEENMTDEDMYCPQQEQYVNDSVILTWSGAGNFTVNTGDTVGWWYAPTVEGEAEITVVADDTGDPVYADDASVSDTITLTVINHIYVDEDATGDDDGTTWTNAFDSLEDALDEAEAGNEIWVAAGTYTPVSERYPDDGRSVTFNLKDKVMIYGGFAGTETSRSQRDPDTNVTILSGNFDEDEDDTDNAWHVVAADSEDVTPAGGIDGCTITKGYADAGSPENNGGGIYNTKESPLIQNCIIKDNYASANGAGIYNNYASSQETIGCDFTNNDAGGEGGAMYSYQAHGALIDDCSFENNTADAGGAVYNKESSYHKVTNSYFKHNDATVTHGGGLYTESSSDQKVVNCVFYGNDADDNGGGLFIKYQTSDQKITNCSFTQNSSTNGGAIGIDQMTEGTGHGDLYITNCILWANHASSTAAEVYETGADDSHTYINYCDIAGDFDGFNLYSDEGTNNDFYGDTGTKNVDPEFVFSGYDNSDTTDATGSTDELEVSDSGAYALGDIIEYNHDHTGRMVTEIVDGDTIKFYPTRSTTVADKEVYQWDSAGYTTKTTNIYSTGGPNYVRMPSTADADTFSDDDQIEYDGDGELRRVIAVSSVYVYFTPFLTSGVTQANKTVRNYGHDMAIDIDTDCDIQSTSDCIDAGDSSAVHRFDVADITRINARIIDDLSTNPVGDHVDIGAHEYSASPVTPPAVETITIVHLCFIDESWGSYETQASKYETDLNYYRSLMLSGMADEFKSGALAIENGIAALLPTGADAPDDVVILDVPDLPFEEDELYGDASAYFETICDGADPDYIILSRDTSSLSLPDMEEGSYGYDEFQTWLASTYPDAEIEERTFSSSGTTEYWLAEMAVALLDVSEQHDLD